MGSLYYIMKKHGKEQAKLVTYEVGDHVLFWEPAQPVKLQTPAQAKRSATCG